MPKGATLSQKFLAEFLGTLLFVFIVSGSVAAASFIGSGGGIALLLIAVAQGIGLAVAVTFAMAISGGSINPAVTIGLLATGRINSKTALAYVVAEVLGAIVGSAFAIGMFPVHMPAADYGVTNLAQGITPYQGIFVEGVITFVLMLTVMGTAVDKRAPKMGGLGIGLVLIALILIAGAVTGASANPARTIGPEIVTASFPNWYVYWVGPVIGAVVAALVYDKMLSGKFGGR